MYEYISVCECVCLSLFLPPAFVGHLGPHLYIHLSIYLSIYRCLSSLRSHSRSRSVRGIPQSATRSLVSILISFHSISFHSVLCSGVRAVLLLLLCVLHICIPCSWGEGKGCLRLNLSILNGFFLTFYSGSI